MRFVNKDGKGLAVETAKDALKEDDPYLEAYLAWKYVDTLTEFGHVGWNPGDYRTVMLEARENGTEAEVGVDVRLFERTESPCDSDENNCVTGKLGVCWMGVDGHVCVQIV